MPGPRAVTERPARSPRAYPLPLLLGEAPARTTPEGAPPLSGRPARMLLTYMGFTWPDGEEDAALGALFDRANLFDTHAEATPWSVPAARDRAVRMRQARLPPVVVFLGRQVCAAMLLRGTPLAEREPPEFHEWFDLGRPDAATAARAVCIPHPSGLNRLLNEEAERQRVCSTLMAAQREAIFAR